MQGLRDGMLHVTWQTVGSTVIYYDCGSRTKFHSSNLPTFSIAYGQPTVCDFA